MCAEEKKIYLHDKNSLTGEWKQTYSEWRKQTNKPENVIPILFTIEQMQINKKTVIDHKLKHTHIYTQTNKQTNNRQRHVAGKY